MYHGLLWAVLVLMVLLLFSLYWVKMRLSNKPDKMKHMYENGQNVLSATGTAEEFVIRKDDRFEFLVRDGLIVACKDKTRHDDFIFYEED